MHSPFSARTRSLRVDVDSGLPKLTQFLNFFRFGLLPSAAMV
jgi:hypothetical protein